MGENDVSLLAHGFHRLGTIFHRIGKARLSFKSIRERTPTKNDSIVRLFGVVLP